MGRALARTDWKRGRFAAAQQTDEIAKGMRGWRDVWGDEIDYWHLDPGASQFDDVYLEAQGVGRVYTGPTRMPVMHVTHLRGENENGEYGFYYNDTLTFQVAFDLFTQSGMSLADIDTGEYMRDRLTYDQKAFKVIKLSVEGKIIRSPTVINVEAQQIKPDELRDDQWWATYANNPTA